MCATGTAFPRYIKMAGAGKKFCANDHGMVQFSLQMMQLAATNPSCSKKLRETFNFLLSLMVWVAA
jgi:hypothetical protein